MTHFAYENLIFTSTLGLDPVYNDEMTFLNFTQSNCHWLDLTRSLFIYNAGQAAPFACLVQAVKHNSVNAPLVIRMANGLCVILMVLFFQRQAKHRPTEAVAFRIAQYALLLSPTILFFSTKVLRDTILTMLVTISFLCLRNKKIVPSLLALCLTFALRRHLAVSMAMGYMIAAIMGTPFGGALTAILAATGLSWLEFGPFANFNGNFAEYMTTWPFSMSGLHFLIADSRLFLASFERIILQRLLAADTFIPNIILIIFAILPRTRARLFNGIARFLLPCNVWYLYFYFDAGFTAARQTIMPFLPLVFLALADLAVTNGWLRRKQRSLPLPHSNQVQTNA